MISADEATHQIAIDRVNLVEVPPEPPRTCEKTLKQTLDLIR